MPRGGCRSCVSREDRQLFTLTVFCNEAFTRTPYFDVPVSFARCLKPFPFGIGTVWIGDGDGTQAQGDRGQ